MGKRIYIFIFLIFISFYNCNLVNADTCKGEYSYENICGNSKQTSLSSGCGGSITPGDGTISKNNTGICQDDNNKTNNSKEYKDLKIYVLIDDSSSMKGTDGGKKGNYYPNTRKALNSLISGLKSSNFDVTIQMSYFDDDSLLDDFSSINKFGRKIGDAIENMRNHEPSKNTNFNSAIDKAIVEFKKNKDPKLVPIVIFITDGYPTQYGNDKNNNLGHLSSTNYFISALNKFRELRNTIGEDGKIYTVGVNLLDGDNMAKYLLNPTVSNYNNLKKSSKVDEGYSLYSALRGQKTYYETVLGIESYPDARLAHFTDIKIEDGKSKIIFEANDYKKMPFNNPRAKNHLANGKTIMFAGLKKPNAKNCTNQEPIQATFVVKNDSDLKKVKFKNKKCYDNYCSITVNMAGIDGYANAEYCKYGYTVKSRDKAEVLLKAKRIVISYPNKTKNLYHRLKKYELEINGYNKIINKYFSVKKSESLLDTLEKLAMDIVNDTSEDNDNSNKKTFKYEKRTFNNNCEGKNVDLGKNYGFTYNGRVVSISVPIVLTEGITFNVGELSKGIKVDAGRGFSIGNSSITSNVRWYYRRFFDNKKTDPMVYVGQNRVKLSDLKYNNNQININDFDKMVWNKFKGSINNTNDDIRFEVVDSNDVNKVSNMPLVIEKVSSTNNVVYNHDSSNNDKEFKSSYKISQPKACVEKSSSKFYYDDRCNDNNSYASNKDNPNQYYIPYAQKSGEVLIKISGNFGINNLSVNNVCSVNVENGTFVTESDDKFSFRDININDPFPKAGNSYSKIPVNWANWYCSSNSAGSCIINRTNKDRLSKSYNNKIYEITLDRDAVSKINKDTKNNGGYNNNFAGFELGVSPYVSGAKNFGFTIIGGNSFCGIAEFSEDCDKYGR